MRQVGVRVRSSAKKFFGSGSTGLGDGGTARAALRNQGLESNETRAASWPPAGQACCPTAARQRQPCASTTVIVSGVARSIIIHRHAVASGAELARCGASGMRGRRGKEATDSCPGPGMCCSTPGRPSVSAQASLVLVTLTRRARCDRNALPSLLSASVLPTPVLY